MGSPRWHLYFPVTRSGPAVAQAMGTGMEQAKAVGESGSTSKRGQETTQEPGGVFSHCRQIPTAKLKADAALGVAPKPTCRREACGGWALKVAHRPCS